MSGFEAQDLHQLGPDEGVLLGAHRLQISLEGVDNFRSCLIANAP